MAENEKQLIEYCKQLIEEKLNWGDSREWRNKEFIDLSDTIYDATGLRVSASTLKRLWGRIKYEGIPNHYTLDALANFLAYSSWKHFKTVHYRNLQPLPQEQVLEEVLSETEAIPNRDAISTSSYENTATHIANLLQEESALPKKLYDTDTTSEPLAQDHSAKNRYLTWVNGGFALSGIGVGFVITWLLGFYGQGEVNFLVNPPKTILFAYPSVAEDYPVRVKFLYDISAVQEATPQGWHLTNILSFGHDTRAKLIYSSSGSKKGETDYIYPVPGIYNPKIFTNVKQTSQANVLVKSRGWLTQVTLQDTSLLIDKSDTIFSKNKGIIFTKKDLKNFLPNSDTNVVGWLSYSKFDNFGISADNFVMTANIKRPANEVGGLNTVDIRIRGKEHSIQVQFVNKGFKDKIYVGFGEKKGAHYEKPDVYRAFEQDFSEFRKIKIHTKINYLDKTKDVKIFADDTLLYQTTYKEPVGEILGILFGFRNTYGMIKNFEMSGESVRHNFSFNP